MPAFQRAGAALADRLAGFCMQWLSGEDARMVRAAAQVMGTFAEVEGARFGRRVPGLLQTLVPALEHAAQEVRCSACLSRCTAARQHEGFQQGPGCAIQAQIDCAEQQ